MDTEKPRRRTPCAFLLVLLVEAAFAGESERIVACLNRADADVWVMQSGVSNMHMTTSYLADWKVAEIRDVPGSSTSTRFSTSAW